VSAHLPDELLVWGDVEAVGDQILTVAASESLTVDVVLAKPVPAGQTLEVWTHFVSDIERLQVDDPDAPAYFSCESTVAFEPFARPDAKVHGPGTFFPYRRYAGIRLTEEAPAGTRFTFHLDDVSMQTYEETLFNLRFAILEGDDLIGLLGDAFYIVKGSEKAQLWVICPTCVETGTPFSCHIVTLDRLHNKTGDPLEELDFEVTLTGDLEGEPVPAEITFDAEKQHHLAGGIQFDLEGLSYLKVSLKDDPRVFGVSNPIVIKDEWPAKVYWGDVHQHTYFADGRGTPAANTEYAISTSCLDFLSVAPHQEATYSAGLLRIDRPPVQKGWKELQEAAETYNGKDIVTILGSEAGSLARIAAHMNSYYLNIDNRPELERLGVDRSEETRRLFEESDRLELYNRYLDVLESSKGEVLLLPHAHACGGPGRWFLPKRPEYQTNIEICSVHGVFEEFYTQWLEHGHFVGVHGSGDNHMTSTGNGNPGWHYPNTNGLAAAYATDWSRQGVWDAIKHRRTYAVTGNQRFYLDFTVNGSPMGDIVVDGDSTRSLALTVAGTAPILKVDLIKNNDVIETFRPPLTSRRYLRLTWTDSWGSRRVDDSLTTGALALEDGHLTVTDTIHMYHRTDRFDEQDDGSVAFRTNAYSGITRGAILAVDAEDDDVLHVTIDDTYLDRTVLQETLDVPLDARSGTLTRRLDAPDRARRPCYTPEPRQPAFTLESEWIDPEWPKVVALEWQDEDEAPAFYYVRVEQIDGNIAWSSPVWFVDESPFDV
jgi:hypothetical protein